MLGEGAGFSSNEQNIFKIQKPLLKLHETRDKISKKPSHHSCHPPPLHEPSPGLPLLGGVESEKGVGDMLKNRSP